MSQPSPNNITAGGENHKNNFPVKFIHKFTITLDANEEAIIFVNILSGLSALQYSTGNEELKK